MKSRTKEWEYFSYLVYNHIKRYTIPQYGDKPEDQLMHWTPGDCVRQIGKYVSRFSNNARGDEELLIDMLKIAHYACVTFMKLQTEAEVKDAAD
jgi:hypothetical protein